VGLPQRWCVPYQPTSGVASGNWSCWKDHMTLHDAVDNTVVHLQQVHKGWRISYWTRVFTWRPHAHKFSMKASFYSCMICFYIQENYECTVHWNCYCFFLNTPQTMCGLHTNMHCTSCWQDFTSRCIKAMPVLLNRTIIFIPFCYIVIGK
jgi:hypothetical protein